VLVRVSQFRQNATSEADGTPAEGMSVARMVVIRCFCVSAFLRFCVSAFLRFCVSAFLRFGVSFFAR
jgi:hypothetical protein